MGEALLYNSVLTTLDFQCIKYLIVSDFVMLIGLMNCADNNIGAEGATVLGDVLKQNSTLIMLNLWSMKQLIFCDIVVLS